MKRIIFSLVVMSMVVSLKGFCFLLINCTDETLWVNLHYYLADMSINEVPPGTIVDQCKKGSWGAAWLNGIEINGWGKVDLPDWVKTNCNIYLYKENNTYYAYFFFIDHPDWDQIIDVTNKRKAAKKPQLDVVTCTCDNTDVAYRAAFAGNKEKLGDYCRAACGGSNWRKEQLEVTPKAAPAHLRPETPIHRSKKGHFLPGEKIAHEVDVITCSRTLDGKKSATIKKNSSKQSQIAACLKLCDPPFDPAKSGAYWVDTKAGIIALPGKRVHKERSKWLLNRDVLICHCPFKGGSTDVAVEADGKETRGNDRFCRIEACNPLDGEEYKDGSFSIDWNAAPDTAGNSRTLYRNMRNTYWTNDNPRYLTLATLGQV